MVTRFVVLLALVFAAAPFLLGSQTSPAQASHLYVKAYRWLNLNPGGNGHIQYNQCTDGTPAEQNWDNGVENWDTSLGVNVEFDAAVCGAGGAQVFLQWDNTGATIDALCGTTADACWSPTVVDDLGAYFKLLRADIYFRKSTYPNATPASQIGLAAHEWGHNLSLEDHVGQTDCTANSIMGKTATGICLQGPNGPDVGAVRCRVYGCHPNGTLVQVPSGGVYVIYNNTKRHVLSPPVLNSWYEASGSEIVPISQSELDAYGNCCDVGYRPGKLVWSQSENKIYFITNEHPQYPSVPEYFLGRKIWVTSSDVLNDCFWGKQVITDTYGSLQWHTAGPPLSVKCSDNQPYGKHPNGTVVIQGTSAWVLESGKKHKLINTVSVVSTWLFGNDLVGISSQEAGGYPTVNDGVGFRPGRLIRNSAGQIFIVTNDGVFLKAHRRHIFDDMTRNCVFPGESWTQVPDADANKHPLNPALQVAGTNCGQ